MKKIAVYTFFILAATASVAQNSLELLLQASNNESIPYISAEKLRSLQLEEPVVILDTRERKEFETSHIASAKHLGYDFFSLEKMTPYLHAKNTPIVVYCSLGIRSEDIGEKLKKEGFTNIRNLYGGIFEWKNNNLPVVDLEGKATENVHVYNKFWGKWLTKGKKVY